MATVRLTETLTNEIMNVIDNKFASRRKEINEAIVSASAHMSWKMFWSEPDIEHVEAIKDKLTASSNVYLEVRMPDGSTKQIDVKLDNPGPFPQANSGSSWSRIKVQHDNPVFKEYLERVIPLIKSQRALQEECATFQNDVSATLKKFTTVNQALKVWPALEGLLPQETLRKVREKVTREKPTEVAVDQQDLNTKLLKLSILS